MVCLGVPASITPMEPKQTQHMVEMAHACVSKGSLKKQKPPVRGNTVQPSLTRKLWKSFEWANIARRYHSRFQNQHFGLHGRLGAVPETLHPCT